MMKGCCCHKDEFIAFDGLRLDCYQKRAESQCSLPSRMATWHGAQVALQRCPILRAGILSVSQHNSYYFGNLPEVNVKKSWRTLPPPKSGQIKPRFCGHFIPPLTIPDLGIVSASFPPAECATCTV